MRVRTRIHAIAIPVVAVLTALSIPFGVASSAAAAENSAAQAAQDRSVDTAAALLSAVAHSTAQKASAKVDTSSLERQLATLDNSDGLPPDSIQALSDLVRVNSERISRELVAVEKQEAAAAAAAKAAAVLAAANTPDGARATARALAAGRYGWGDGQFSCLSSLWQKESGWNYKAHNPSGAHGIPQSLPGSKMATAGADWQTNAATQIAWGLDYISRAYGSPCAAWAHSRAVNWY